MFAKGLSPNQYVLGNDLLHKSFEDKSGRFTWLEPRYSGGGDGDPGKEAGLGGIHRFGIFVNRSFLYRLCIGVVS